VSARRKARKRALDILFSADIQGLELAEALERARDAAHGDIARASSWDYAQTLAQGVVDHLDEIDHHISSKSVGWPLDRMPAVDRAILRLGVWEILYNSEVPPAVAISEAVMMAQELSTEASGGFVHGILAGISDELSGA
jgi:transcription antitermination protein NusB